MDRTILMKRIAYCQICGNAKEKDHVCPKKDYIPAVRLTCPSCGAHLILTPDVPAQ